MKRVATLGGGARFGRVFAGAKRLFQGQQGINPRIGHAARAKFAYPAFRQNAVACLRQSIIGGVTGDEAPVKVGDVCLNVHGGKDSTKVLKSQSQKDKKVRHAWPMEIETRQLVAANVKRLRQARHMTQTQLGERSGVGQTTVSSVEQPGGKSPTLETLAAIARALDVPEWTLLVDGAALDATQLKAMDALVHAYAALPSSGKTQVLRVAEAEERYAKAS
jgi:transcriptional regulator with XRE-family HTH domain